MNWSTRKPNRQLKAAVKSETAAIVPVVAKVVSEIPGVPLLGSLTGALADLVNEHINRTREAAQRENDQRLTEFYSEVLKVDATMDEQGARALLDDKDFHAILRACIVDIESEKVGAYAAMARGIASGRVAKELRRHFILALRDLSGEELELLRGALVARDNDLIPDHGDKMGEGHFLNASRPDSRQAIGVANLTARGFVYESKLSHVGELFVRACWDPEALTPESLGHGTWTGQNFAIINYEIGSGSLDHHSSMLQDNLRSCGVKSEVVAIVRTNEQQARRLFTGGILLLNERLNGFEDNLPYLTKFASKVPTMLVDVTGQAGDLPGLDLFGRIGGPNMDVAEIVAEVRRMTAAKSRTRSISLRPVSPLAPTDGQYGPAVVQVAARIDA